MGCIYLGNSGRILGDTISNHMNYYLQISCKTSMNYPDKHHQPWSSYQYRKHTSSIHSQIFHNISVFVHMSKKFYSRKYHQNTEILVLDFHRPVARVLFLWGRLHYSDSIMICSNCISLGIHPLNNNSLIFIISLCIGNYGVQMASHNSDTIHFLNLFICIISVSSDIYHLKVCSYFSIWSIFHWYPFRYNLCIWDYTFQISLRMLL